MNFYDLVRSHQDQFAIDVISGPNCWARTRPAPQSAVVGPPRPAPRLEFHDLGPPRPAPHHKFLGPSPPRPALTTGLRLENRVKIPDFSWFVLLFPRLVLNEIFTIFEHKNSVSVAQIVF